MKITVELPNDVAESPDPQRAALEALAIAGYRSGALTAHEAQVLLGLESRFDFDGFLKSRNIYDHAYDVEDLELDLRNLEKIEKKRQGV